MNLDARDPHLLAALRHAPDRDAVPPPEVTQRILSAAREAMQPSRPPPLQGWRAWFMRPQLGAAFATLAVAVLVGVMWSSQEQPAPASVSPDLPQAGQQPAAMAEADRVAPSAPAMPHAPSVAAVPAAPAHAVPAPPRERRLAKNEAGQPAAERARAPDRPTDRASTDATATAAELRADAAPHAAAPADAARARSEVPSVQGGALGRQSVMPATLAEKAASFDPLFALEAADSAGWTWSASVGERAQGAAQRELWAAMRAATQGRWEPAQSTRPPAPWLLLRNGERSAVLWWMNGALYLADADGRTWRAPVTPEQARDWQQAVARW